MAQILATVLLLQRLQSAHRQFPLNRTCALKFLLASAGKDDKESNPLIQEIAQAIFNIAESLALTVDAIQFVYDHDHWLFFLRQPFYPLKMVRGNSTGFFSDTRHIPFTTYLLYSLQKTGFPNALHTAELDDRRFHESLFVLKILNSLRNLL